MSSEIPPIINPQATSSNISQPDNARVLLTRVKGSTWVLLFVYLLCGGFSGIVLLSFGMQLHAIYLDVYDSDTRLPLLTRMVFSIPLVPWVAIWWGLGTLLVWRDIGGKRAVFPNWMAILVLIALLSLIGAGLLLPLFLMFLHNGHVQ